MSASQRRKGATYERDIADIFSTFFGVTFARKLGQARDSGNDLDVGPLVIEIKRRKTLKTVMSWYAQAKAALKRYTPLRHSKYGVPYAIVVMREDAGPSMVLLSLGDFLELTECRLAELVRDEDDACEESE